MRRDKTLKPLAIGAAAAVLSFASANALACGESLFRIGKGVAYRAQTAPLPGSIVVVAPNDAAKGLAERLAAAGHHVHVVESSSLLAQELSGGEFDIVLAPFADREVVAAQTASAASSVAYVPVTLEASEEALADQLYKRSVGSRDSFTDFLRVIHRTLKHRA